MSLPWIVVGDRTSHGGTVLEGDPWTDIEGKRVATVGHQVACPKCKGSYPIVTGAEDTRVSGQPVARHGDYTHCGAVLISSQFLTYWCHRTSGAGFSNAHVDAQRSSKNEQYDEQAKLVADTHVTGLPYFIALKNGGTLSGYLQEESEFPRIETEGPADYQVYWGDDALARMES
jgi:uncharacterized Zn-binding protein involved in type VI secretion